jgi:leishmanolysin-like peptidase
MSKKKICNLTFKYLFIIWILLFIKTFQRCGFDTHNSKKTKKFHLFHEEDEKLRFLQNSKFQSIRIVFDYTTLDNQSFISTDIKTSIKKVLGNAQYALQNLILVKRLITKAKISICDSSVTISDTISKVGVEADLVIFPFVDSILKGNTEAYASGCVISAKNNRPVAGLMAFTMNFNQNKDNWLDYYTSIAIHELTHVLAFNPDLFNLFIDENGANLSIDKIIRIETVNGVSRNLIITPRVVAAARKHFGCSNLIGVELENQGSEATVASHWEARIMLSDYMIGVSYDEMTISEISLAFLEDSGWYKVNYFTGGLFRYGKNQGCGFLSNKCVSNDGSVKYTNEFCNSRYAPMCTAGKTSKGICYVTTYINEIDNNYKYFSSSKLGGLMLADYCPITEVPTNYTSYFPWSCSLGFSNYPKELEESISDKSACFMSNLVNKKYQNDLSSNYYEPRSICYQYECDFPNKRINVIIGQKTITCPIGGGMANLEGYLGSIICPDFNQICTSSKRCINMVDCAVNMVYAEEYTYDYSKMNIVFNSTASYDSTVNMNNSTGDVLTNEKYNKPLPLYTQDCMIRPLLKFLTLLVVLII